MLFIILIVSNILVNADSDIGYCDATIKSCETNEGSKFLFYDVNPPEGFNLRRDVYMRFAVMMAEARKKNSNFNWRLVLPPWYRMYHWHSNDDPLPWSKFFDIDSMRSFAPVVELHEVFKQKEMQMVGKLEIDTLYVLQNFEDPFEGGSFVDKWNINKECDFQSNFWGYKNISAKETVCVQFQGQISKLWEIVALHPNNDKVMFAHGEIPLHDNYGTKIYWDCRRSMKFNDELIKTAEDYISKVLNCDKPKCDNYVGVHWRRQDFTRSRHNDVPSLEGTVKQIAAAMKTHTPNISDIYIASDAAIKELEKVEGSLRNLGYNVHIYIPNITELDRFQDGGIAIIDQIICSHAAYFIGTHESTFSFRIQEEREILGFDSKTTFNRLCPDKGRCERPSKWTIVN